MTVLKGILIMGDMLFGSGLIICSQGMDPKARGFAISVGTLLVGSAFYMLAR